MIVPGNVSDTESTTSGISNVGQTVSPPTPTPSIPLHHSICLTVLQPINLKALMGQQSCSSAT
jgi:hypothetical protein